MTNDKQTKQKKLTEVDPKTVRLAADLPMHKNVAPDLRKLAAKIEAGEIDEEAIFKEFARIQRTLDAYKQAVEGTSTIQENTKTRITKSKLKKIIQEELSRVLKGWRA